MPQDAEFLQHRLPLEPPKPVEIPVCPPETDTDEAAETFDVPANPVREFYTVTELSLYLQDLIELDPVLGQPVVVKGEVSNVSRSSRGHMYFTLKDENACLKGVLWAGLAKMLPFDLEDGLEVYVTGQVELYLPYGTYSLVASRIEPAGLGALQLAFEQIKARLEAEGLFSPEFKQPLPEFPEKIGIITSHTGAVIHDMLRVIRRKNPRIDVLVIPVPVQGQGAAESIAAAIRQANRPELGLDALIVARGGGSLEDLFCFSEEPVVRAIFASRLPIVTGIGHEPDFSLADAVADFSASTPTAAAEHLVPDYQQFVMDVTFYRQQVVEGMRQRLLFVEQQFDNTATQLLETYQRRLQTADQELDRCRETLVLESKRYFETWEQRLSQAAAELHALSPLATLARGYAVATTPQGEVISSIQQLLPRTCFKLTVADGDRMCHVQEAP